MGDREYRREEREKREREQYKKISWKKKLL